eukprot:6038419-Pleurochrysis_carterae.AAC.1
MHVKEIKSGMVWISRLPLPNSRPGWVLVRDHPSPSCVGSCLRCSRRFRHCRPICMCARVSVEIRSSRVTGSASAKLA